MTDLLVDTSLAIPLLVTSHAAHDTVSTAVGDRSVALAGHALNETYAVLTRLPGDARVAPADAARLLRDRFEAPVVLDARSARAAPAALAHDGIVGGATYDGLIALAARGAGLVLASRDRRAEATCSTMEWVPQCYGAPDKTALGAFCVSEPDAGSDVSRSTRGNGMDPRPRLRSGPVTERRTSQNTSSPFSRSTTRRSGADFARYFDTSDRAAANRCRLRSLRSRVSRSSGWNQPTSDVSSLSGVGCPDSTVASYTIGTHAA
jgi:hypothetical protein